ncbi:hypothetical protein CO2235_150077 [Cupriavidus oxalaticus]|uniref:Uncharacterized protein n=1 Tax=Cupriavidus oxalaticus TaxID=96344 RepID=A0A375FNW7_9BURK|nr:hypothetical protein CO2235_U600043 [Cupriavidus oxalaticus]SPC12422.1 hypothetical protein CO2235_150077 [Cupriavidus oxalaticus]
MKLSDARLRIKPILEQKIYKNNV